MSAAARARSDPVLDALAADIDDDLRFLTQLVGRLRERAAGVEFGELESAVAAVARRRRDLSLYLAVVGEFSSGKTSFTNVLLGERLLETSPLPNTAAVTSIRQGPRRTMSVRFRGDARDLPFPSPELADRLATYNRRSDTFEQVLGIASGDEEVAPAIERVTLEHPSPLLGDGIVVLDTPGVNSTIDAHTTTAIETIARDADAFVVLVPSSAPLGLNLQRLLREQLAPYLHRTTFVITHMEHVDEAERASVRRFVERRLQRELGVEAPIVAVASLGAAMRARVGDPDARPDDAEWLTAFEGLRAELVDRLRSERAATVAERVTVLLQQALRLLEASLRREADALSERARVLKHSAPADLDRFCAKTLPGLRTALNADVTQARQRLEAALAAAEARTTKAVEAALKQATTTAQLDAALDGAGATVTAAIGTLETRATTALRTVSAAVGTHQRDFDARFEQQFDGLDRLAGERPRSPQLAGAVAAVTDVSADARALKAKLDRRAGWTAAGGAGVGALIGTFIAPGIGTLIGAGLGGLFSSDGPSVAERRATYWPEVEREIRATFSGLRPRYMAALDAHAAAAAAHLEAHVERYRTSYGRAIRRLSAAHAEAQRDLQRQRRQGTRDAAQVEARVALLRERTATLASMARARR